MSNSKQKVAICINCGGEFLFYPSNSSGKFCSPECYRKSRWGESHKTTIICQVCGESREYFKSSLDIGCGVTCGNIKCRSAALRDQETYSCQWCGKEFQWAANRPRKFCSRACYGEAIKIRDGSGGNKKGAWRKWQRKEWLEDSCCLCGSTKNLELDHIIPRTCGGSNIRSNAQTLCRKCHAHKRITKDREMLAKIGKRDY